MRIENRPVNPKDNLKKRDNISKKKEGVSFLDALKDIDGEDEILIEAEDVSQEDMKSLADLIGELGESLSKEPSPESFNKYRKHIRLFIKLALDNLEVKVVRTQVTLFKAKERMTIETIDESLSQIAKLILNNEKDRLNYLKLTNNIRGLLIDLIL